MDVVGIFGEAFWTTLLVAGMGLAAAISKRWAGCLEVVFIYLFLIVVTTPLSWLLSGLLGASYERASMLAGFCGIFAYMYLFPQIPVAHRIFTYFFVDTTMNLVVLFARGSSVLLAPCLPVHPDLLFAIFYLPPRDISFCSCLWIPGQYGRNWISGGMA